MKTKFSIGELLGVGFTIIVLGIGVAYGLEVMGDIKTDMADNAGASTATNEAITFVNGSEVSLALDCVSGLSCTALVNGTGNGLEFTSGNYSCSGDSITITLVDTNLTGTPTTLNANYTCDESTLEYNATADGMTGVAKIPEKIPMIVTIVVASTIIGILLTYLWGRIAGKM